MEVMEERGEQLFVGLLGMSELWGTWKVFGGSSERLVSRGGVGSARGGRGNERWWRCRWGRWCGRLETSEEGRVLLTELAVEGAETVVVYGGRGGLGNVHFASSTNQEPLIALGGEPGEEREIELEVKLLADVALIGVPNAGKSTLLSVVSRAKPKIADYPFTTLEPGFGMAQVGDRLLVVLDVPGLIEGAHEGRGLGLEFLRHCERARVFVHLVDGMAEDLSAEYETIREEIASYGAGLAEKASVVAVTKMDVPEARERYEEQNAALAVAVGSAPMAIAAVTGEGIRELMRRWRGSCRLRCRRPFKCRRCRGWSVAGQRRASAEMQRIRCSVCGGGAHVGCRRPHQLASGGSSSTVSWAGSV